MLRISFLCHQVNTTVWPSAPRLRASKNADFRNSRHPIISDGKATMEPNNSLTSISCRIDKTLNGDCPCFAFPSSNAYNLLYEVKLLEYFFKPEHIFKLEKQMLIDPVLPLTRFDQIGIAVKDVDKTGAFMNQSFGIEFLTMEMPRARALLRGKEVEFISRIGIAKVGEMDLELVQILEGEHIVKEFLDRNGPGLHHLGIYVDDLEAALGPWQKAGGTVVQETAHPEGIGTVYLDTENELENLYVELIKL